MVGADCTARRESGLSGAREAAAAVDSNGEIAALWLELLVMLTGSCGVGCTW